LDAPHINRGGKKGIPVIALRRLRPLGNYRGVEDQKKEGGISRWGD